MLVLKEILDPRDNLEKANRDQIVQFAERRGIKQIDWRMPATQMRSILRSMNIVDIGLPAAHGSREALQNLAFNGQPPDNPPLAKPKMLEELEREQWAQQAKQAEQIERERSSPPISEMTRAEMAKECKRRGIKMERKDTKEKLAERLGV